MHLIHSYMDIFVALACFRGSREADYAADYNVSVNRLNIGGIDLINDFGRPFCGMRKNHV
jgi:hypothetical protein